MIEDNMKMKLLTKWVGLCLFNIATTGCSSNTEEYSSDLTEFSEEQGHSRIESAPTSDNSEAEQRMVESLAATQDVSEVQVRERLRFEDQFVTYSRRILSVYPGQVSAAWLSLPPVNQGFIRFVSGIPEGLEVFSSDHGRVDFLTDGKIPLEEHELQIDLAAQAMQESGYSNFAALYDVHHDRIIIELKVPPQHGPLPKEGEIGALVRRKLANKTAAGGIMPKWGRSLVEEVGVGLRVIEAEGPIAPLISAKALGGQLMSGSGSCTSGFAATKGSFFGVIGAGHCALLTRINPLGYVPQTASIYSWTMSQGDSGFWRTEIPIENRFYYSTNHTQYCNSKWEGSFATAIGQSICSYGRASDNEMCGSVLYFPITANISGTFLGTVTVSHLARATYAGHIAGDSGGPVYKGNKAMGVMNAGSSTISMHFTPVPRVEYELGVNVLTE